MHHRKLLLSAGIAWIFAAQPSVALDDIRQPARPNVIVILADDLGYGDLSVQGHPLIRTPNIDRLAAEGQRWTSFYASGPMCAPSREALMTGRMPIRIHENGKNMPGPLPDAEVTIGELLERAGYATAYIGKWGLTEWRQFDYRGAHPNEQGFDYFYGLVTSNGYPLPDGMQRTYASTKSARSTDFPVPLYRQRTVIEMPVDQATLTQRYTEESVRWIRGHSDEPFFLFLAHTMPHVPIFASRAFDGRSKAGRYGDVVEELDWSVGQVVKALQKEGIDKNTLIIFSSDNGPWRTYYDLGGWSGPWRDGKLTGWEGAYRVPGIFWWPGRIASAVVDGIGVNVDLLSTIASLTKTPLPGDRKYDSIDLSPTLLQGRPSPRNEWFFYSPTGKLWGARVGHHKLVYESRDSLGRTEQLDYGYGKTEVHDPPLLFDLSTDMGERLNIADKEPDVVALIEAAVDRHNAGLPTPSLIGTQRHTPSAGPRL